MKQKFLNLTAIFALILVAMVGFAQSPVTWNYSVNPLSDNQAELVISAEIAEGYHLYSQHQNGIARPLKISLKQNKSFDLAENSPLFSEPKYTEFYDAEMDDTERFFTKKVSFTKILTVHDREEFVVEGTIDGQICTNQSCMPLHETFAVSFDGELEQNVDPTPVFGNFQQISTTTNEPEPQPISAEKSGETSLWLFFILAFAGGLLGILTPCVFPMIPMTISYFMKHGGKRQAIFYGISIVAIYLLVGILLSAIFGQDFANIISTHWLPNCLFAVIFIVFAVSLLGYFEISLPSSWVNKAANNEGKKGYAGTFFMALTLVLVSFSCTLPIAGTVALGAAGGGFLKPIVGMLGFSLAFALPFTFFAFFPKLLSKLPKSGGWMNTLKVSLAFVELAFALKFLSVPDQTYHWHLLDREIYLALWIVIFSLLGFYLLGKIRFPHDDEATPVQKSWFKFFVVIADFAFVVYMIPGLFGAPLNGLSGWLPPMHTQDFNLTKTEKIGSKTATFPEVSFSEQLSLVHGLNGFFDYDEARNYAKKVGKPLFLDFTGHGCVNCRKVEQKVLSNSNIQTILNEKFVVCALYIDDKVVELPPHLQLKNSNGETLTMLGDKNRFLQSSLFGENSQPCYLIVDPNTQKLLAPPMHYETDVAIFEKFLLEQRIK